MSFEDTACIFFHLKAGTKEAITPLMDWRASLAHEDQI